MNYFYKLLFIYKLRIISIRVDFIFAEDGIFNERWVEMHQGKFVFSQIMDLIPWERFQTCVNRYNGDYRIQEFKCSDYFKVMIFAQLTYRESLRDIVNCFRAIPQKCYHLGICKNISRNNLSNATQRRNWMIFADFANVVNGHFK